MKTLTCKELGGTWQQKLSAHSWGEVIEIMTEHVIDKHPDVAIRMEKMHREHRGKWSKEMRPKWDAAPER